MGRVELTPYLERLSAGLDAAATGGPATSEAAARLALLDALAGAAEEITARLGGATVEVRLRGPDADLVVTRPVAPAGPVPPADDGDLARLTLRLPEALRTHVEQTAAVEGISVNTWLVRAVTVAVNQQHGPPPAAHGAWTQGLAGTS